MVLVKKLPFFLFFYALYTRKMCSMLSQNVKTPFQAIKTRISKSRKIDIFPKGLSHGFFFKNGPFSMFFFLRIIDQENVFYDILERKTPFQAIKTRNLKSRKFQIFPKVLSYGFGPKMAIFPTFIFTLYRPGKCIL